MAANNPQGYSPMRPAQVRDVSLTMAGEPNFLGIITASGSTVVDNSTTATPFKQEATQQANGGVGSLAGTLAGKMLLLQADGECYFMASTGILGAVGTSTVARQGTVPPTVGTVPGVHIATSNLDVKFFMAQSKGWLQVVSANDGTTVNVYVYELL